ncbi:MAG: enoyl-CoA hydratase-related protein, partial [Hylemonella sp.]
GIGIFKSGALALIGDISSSTRQHASNMNLVEGFFGVGAIVGPAIVTMLLPWMTSPKHAKRIIFSGQDNVSAQLAMDMGLVSEVVQAGQHLDKAMRIARNIARMDPDLVQQTKKAIQKTYDMQGMEAALSAALDIDHAIESQGSPDKVKFMDIARSGGLQAALAWRAQRFEAE